MTRSQTLPSPDLDQQARGHASLNLWLVNVLLGVLVGTAYLRHLPDDVSARGWVFVIFGLFSCVATLALIPGLISWGTLRFLSRMEAQAWIQALCGAAFLSIMKVDTVVYELLRYHFFSSAVFNVAVTPGSEDAVHLGGHVWIPVAIAITLLTVGQFLGWRYLYRHYLETRSIREFSSLFSRPVAIWAVVLLLVIGVEKSIYAAADIEGDREVTYVSEVLPAYSPLRVSKYLPEGLGLDVDGVTGIELQPKGAPLAYPHEWPQLDSNGRRPNVLILVIDSWRRDALSEEASPRLYELSREAMRFDNHHAGGNGTRFGIFTMLYGLHGSYWFSALKERRSPVLLDVLQGEGYEVRVHSSASMNFPEFRDCAFTNCADGVRDQYPQEKHFERDLAVADDFAAFIEARQEVRESGGQSQPFFGFLLLDSAHQPYSYPGEGKFQPTAEGIDYVELSHDRSPELIERLHNRYLNAVHFADSVAADLIEDLRASGELDDTLVIVTGDHGEEFQESSFWGHTSNFTTEQIGVPFFIIGAGIEQGVEVSPTSHLDIAPTVLELMGADPTTRGTWCLGENLFDPPGDRDVVVSGWEHVGVITPELIFRIRMGGGTSRDVSVYDVSWRPQNDANHQIEIHETILQQVSEECGRFLVGVGTQ